MPVGAMRPGDHWCTRFSSDAEQRDIAAAYVRDGLAHDDKVVYFCSGDETRVEQFLTERGVAVGPSVADGQLRVLSPEKGYLSVTPFDPDVLVARLRSMVADAQAEGFRCLRAIGEVDALRGSPGWERLPEYERKVAAVYDGGAALGLCQYDERLRPPAGTAAVQDAHRRRAVPNPLFSDALLSIVPSYSPSGVRMIGEIDISHGMPGDNRVLRALRGMTHDLHVDLSGLRFLDVAGARLLAQVAEHLDRHNSLMVLRRPGRNVLSVLRLTGWDRLPNVVVDDLG
jgi:anti-anti-sigma factor